MQYEQDNRHIHNGALLHVGKSTEDAGCSRHGHPCAYCGAVVSTNNGQRVVSDYTGRFHTQLPFSSATVSKKHYMQRRVNATDLRQDTIFLIPQEVVLNDVVVTAPGMSFDVNKAMRKDIDAARLPKPSEGFNLLGLFQLLVPSAKAKAQSRAEKIKKILNKY